MSITQNDIAAQRAMLARGEEQRKADWKQAERERLRDTFAAAALTGLLVNGPFNTEAVPRLAYSMADAMLRERNGAVAGCETVTLTDEERAAIYRAEARLRTAYVPDDETSATLRKLLERLRNGSVDARETVCPHVRGTVTQHCSLNFTLTAQERSAVAYFAVIEGDKYLPAANTAAATLRSLLERLAVE
jgi:hypothetical protein